MTGPVLPTRVDVEEILGLALSEKGDRYIFGTETRALDPNPEAFDCSELVEWACARAGVSPRMPDGAYFQWMHCREHRLEIAVDRALAVRGALLFSGDGTGKGRDAIVHVAFSLGNGTTIEARGKAWGVGTWAGRGRFQFGGLIPGVAYRPAEATTTPARERLVLDGVLGPATCGALQRALNRRGAQLAVDGEFGPQTRTALRRYLRLPDGELDVEAIRDLQVRLNAGTV